MAAGRFTGLAQMRLPQIWESRARTLVSGKCRYFRPSTRDHP
jgi:hypothetical protein